MKENDKKRKIIFTIVFILLAIVLLIGSSYAYFSLGVDTSQSKPTTITGKTSKLGNVTLKGLIGELHLNLSASDMAKSNMGDYFATKDPDKSYEKEQEAGTYQISSLIVENVNEDTKYSCTANVRVTMTIDGENNMGSVIHENDLFLYLKGGNLDETIDLIKLQETGTGTYPIEFSTTGPETQYIKAYVKLVNKEVEQNYLAGKTLNMEIINEGLKCTNDKSMTGLELAKKGSKGLEETPNTGDLIYRYVGACNAGDSDGKGCDGKVDNFICFGADSCSGVTDDHMYRILGIDNNGRLKLIKNTALSEKYAWHSYNSQIAVWDSGEGIISADLYVKLNNAIFLNNTIYLQNGWQNKIDGNIWNIGTSEGVNSGYTDIGKEVLNWEQEVKSTQSSKIGLMYLSDYYYSLDGTGSISCYNGINKEQCKSSWLHLSNNGNIETTSERERTILRYGTSGNIWSIYEHGRVDYWDSSIEERIRPVFYLNSDVTLTTNNDSSPKGSVDNPWIVEL